jgi:hypothetical protein
VPAPAIADVRPTSLGHCAVGARDGRRNWVISPAARAREVHGPYANFRAKMFVDA